MKPASRGLASAAPALQLKSPSCRVFGSLCRTQILWDRYLTESHGLVFLVDSTDHERLEQAQVELDRLLGDPALRDCPFYILCNKQDDHEHAWSLPQVGRAVLVPVTRTDL